MIDEDELRGLAERTIGVPTLGAVVHRGRRIRRARRIGRVTAAVAVLSVAAGGVAVLARAGDDAPATEVAAPFNSPTGAGTATDDWCGGYAEQRAPGDAGVPRLLPNWLPHGVAVDAAWATADITDRRTCPAVPIALIAVREDGTGGVSAGVRLEGPSPEPYRRYDGPSYELVAVRGDQDAHLVRFPTLDASILRLEWTEPDGTSWSMTGYGLDPTALRAVATHLELDGLGGSPVARLPGSVAGLDEVWRLEQTPGELQAESPSWHVVVDDGETLSIDVSRPLVPSPAIARLIGPGAQLVEVRGHTAVAFDNGSPSHLWLVWDEEPGLQVSVDGDLDLETLRRIAESLAPAAADDPRIGRR